jgi:hypothetical protein
VGFMSVGDIDYHGVIYTIWVGANPKLAQQSWEMQKSKHFPDYTGPDPPLLEGLKNKSIERLNARV